jgi:hypothetical protein
MIKKSSILFLFLGFSFFCLSQDELENLIYKKWFFCDTNFNYQEMEYLLLRNDQNCDIFSKNHLSGSLELKNNGEFVLTNVLPCEPLNKLENRVINICKTQQIATFQLEEYFLILEGEKYNIDVINGRFLYLRKEKE